ncbi:MULTISPECIES: HAD family phosphatase [unclassified Myxococcus]|uniref:HAD family hydrolase n=1 Tax=unclassified Myxococcus TaxID=2648731 RepID=UPI001CC16D4A|nr:MULTISPECIES: HAD family phosphatase [unclassified Myxococcus]MBZ4394773.1 HAD family phosphatase [Myxococcus sp. AS-1-15]MBZ4410245.1 HAD family phosphatase [Myxococcus sp. XM-1-1-1]
MRRLAVLDLDGTLTPDTLGALLVRELTARGVCDGTVVRELLAAVERHDVGGQDFFDAVADVYRGWERLFAGVAVPSVERAAEDVWAQARGHLFGFVRPLLRMLEAEGFLVALVSGGPIEMVHLVAEDLGIDVYRGAQMAIQRNRYTGQVLQGPGRSGGKPGILQELASLHRASLERSLAMGNSLSDGEILALVGFPLAFEPSPELADLAVTRGWSQVDRHDVLHVLPVLLAGEQGGEGVPSA